MALCITAIVSDIDIVALSVAGPTLSTELHATTGQLLWANSIYGLVIAACLIPLGTLGDRFGRKRFLLVGLGLFGLASVFCGFAQSPGQLIAGRALLGFAATLMLSLGAGIVPMLFPDQQERGRALAALFTAAALGTIVGPIGTGWILKNYWWGWVFLVNIPLVIIGIIAVFLFIPETRGKKDKPIDFPAIALSTLALLGIIYGIINGGQYSWTNISTILPILIGCLAVIAVLWQQQHSLHPLLKPLFRNKDFVLGGWLAAVSLFIGDTVQFGLPQFFQAIDGTDPVDAAAQLLPFRIGVIAGNLAVGRLIARITPRLLISLGLIISILGLLLGMTTIAIHTSFTSAALWTSALGLGIGIIMPTAISVAYDAITKDGAGASTAVLYSFRNVGIVAGIAALGAVLNFSYRTKLHNEDLPEAIRIAANDNVSVGVASAQEQSLPIAVHAVQSAFAHGFRVMLGAASIVAIVGLIAIVRRGLRPQPKPKIEPAQATEEIEATTT